MMAEMEFVVDYVEDCDDSDLPEDVTVANFAIYVDDDCLTRNRQRHRSRLFRASETVFGPVAGLADWFIENWGPILWETQTPFKKGGLGITVGDQALLPGLNEEAGQFADGLSDDEGQVEPRDEQDGWDEDSDYARDTRDATQTESVTDPAEIADWQHRHLLGHACSNLAIPSIVILSEDRHVVLSVDRLPTGLNPSVEFVTQDNKPRRPTVFFLRKTAFKDEIKGFIDQTIERARSSQLHLGWADWLNARWLRAQEEEAEPARRLAWMLGDLSAKRVEELNRDHPELANGMTQLLLDCPIVTRMGDLQPIEDMVNAFVLDPALSHDLGGPAGWEAVGQESIPVRQADFLQGYQLAQKVRSKLALGIRPIGELSSVLRRLDVVLEEARQTPLFRAAACASHGKHAHIIPSSIDDRSRSPLGSRFAVMSALGRLLWQSMSAGDGPICAAQGDHAMLSQSRRANAFAAEILLPREAIKKLSPDCQDLWKKADVYGISFAAARWHAHNVDGLRLR